MTGAATKGRWDKVWEQALEIYELLKGSPTMESAREKMIAYLGAIEWSYRRDLDAIPSWDYIQFKESIRCFYNIISPRNERLAGSSALEHLWTASREGDSEVADDFVEEFYHLFRAVKGHSVIYPSSVAGGEMPDFSKYKGREAAVIRSDFLDRMGKQMDHYLERYKCGLDPDVVEVRKGNRTRILERLGGSEDDWEDWHWQFRNVFKDSEDLPVLKELIEIGEEQTKAIELSLENQVPFGVTPHYLHLMDRVPSDHDYAVRRQVLPPMTYVSHMAEHTEDRRIAFDFMREHDTSPEDLITRRYPRVAIMKPYDSCPQICVYCQRNWEITAPLMPSAMASKEEIEAAVAWYGEHTEMMDVLLTGGDPMVMSDDRLEHFLEAFADMDHIQNIRIATRIPITVPMRLTKEVCELFGSYMETGKRMICMVTHAEHPYEITPETAEAIEMVRRQGIYVYNQQVFTFAGSRRFESVALRIALKRIGIDPYYTFNMKGKSEIEDYAVPVARILQERKEEARLLPGVYRTDEPVFNVPALGKNHLRAWQDHELIAIMPDGRRVYSFHAWEKNISRVNPFLYTDVTIKHYLDMLKDRGEDPEEYRSIWYYY